MNRVDPDGRAPDDSAYWDRWGNTVTSPAPAWHCHRNANNHCPTHAPNTCSSENDRGWQQDWWGSKWRSPQGDECAYDQDGNLKPDQDANYTYNYAPDPYTWDHVFRDFVTHFIFLGPDAYDPGLTHRYECE
jgi:hypothetical protein